MSATSEDRWASRPALARAVRLLAYLVPLVVGTLAGWIAAIVLPIAPGFWPTLWAWVLFLGPLAYIVYRLAGRVTRRLLPLATLLDLSLAFPDRAPERYLVWREIRTERDLKDRAVRAREEGLGGSPADVAQNILALVAAMSFHDKRTRGHSERVRIFADMIAEQLRMPEEDRDRLRWASLLHDVGKIVVPADVLNTRRRLTDDQWQVIREHPQAGADLAGPLHDWLGEWVDTIAQHHERWDGAGYPKGLAGADIFIGARIVAVADAFEVMTSPRAYSPPVKAHVAREELVATAGEHFDPDIVRAFLEISLGELRRAVGLLPALLQAIPLGGRLLRVGVGLGDISAFDGSGGDPGAGATAAGDGPDISGMMQDQ